MTTKWTWADVDYSKAQPGDIISEDRPAYIKSIEVLSGSAFSAKVLSPEYRINLVEYSHQFHWKDEPGAGYSFGCLEDGTLADADRLIEWTDGTSITVKDHFESKKNDPDLVYDGIDKWERSFRIAKVIECVCGDPVSLDMVMTNTCDKCGSDYNVGGQRLAPREQWGWDTGESLSDILSSDWGINDSPDYAFSDEDY